MQVLPAQAKDEKKVTQEGIQEVNQNGECLVNLCKLNILETNKILCVFSVNKLTWMLFVNFTNIVDKV